MVKRVKLSMGRIDDPSLYKLDKGARKLLNLVARSGGTMAKGPSRVVYDLKRGGLIRWTDFQHITLTDAGWSRVTCVKARTMRRLRDA